MNEHHTLLTDELKERIDIVELIATYLPLKKNGTGYKGSCPFHYDKDLSLDIYPETQTWRCSTECAERQLLNGSAQSNRGDALDFVSRVEGMSFGQAVRKLATRCGLAPDVGENTTQDDPGVQDRRPERRPRGRRRMPSMFRFGEVMEATFPTPEDPYLKLDNLGYKGRISRISLSGSEEFKRFMSGRQPRPGMVVALHTTLQGHCKIEYPNGVKETFDSQGTYDAGEIIWTERGQASVIVKNIVTGVHVEVALQGVTTKGFCLFNPPGLTEPMWFWPREPKAAGGRGRPFYYKTEESPQGYDGADLESLAVDSGLLTEYRDISGVVVPVSPVRRSRNSHEGHLGTGPLNS